MRITSIGGGPGGLYAAILLALADPRHEITVYERNAADDTFGWGVVFSRATLAELSDADAPSYRRIMHASARWDPVDVWFLGQRIRARGNGFAAIARKRLLGILQGRCAELGVDLRFQTEVEPAEQLDADLVLGADGVNSPTRTAFAGAFRPRLTREGGKFIWLGTTKMLDAFTFFFREHAAGWFHAHAYPFSEELSTFIVETDEATWRAAGLDHAEADPPSPGRSDEASIAFCAELFAEDLDGHELLGNSSRWIDWVTVRNRAWRHGNVVLLGDAAHTAHFSIGSGTKLAMEDAARLARAVQVERGVDAALTAYESDRRAVVDRTQQIAGESLDWFARYHRYVGFEPPQFAFSLLSRSTRVTHENMRRRDPILVGGLDRWFAERSGLVVDAAPLLAPPPPAFTPLRVGATTFANRLILATRPQGGSDEGAPTDARRRAVACLARGGAGLVLVEGVAVSPEARTTTADLGLYRDAHVGAWKELVADAQSAAGTPVGVHLRHAGARGATRSRAEGADRPLREGAWPLVAASPLPYTPASQRPQELDEAGMDALRDAFATAASAADHAGFDLLEVDVAHGYLLAGFVSPLTNQREDRYGGALERRLRFPLSVLAAVRGAWPAGKPLSVRCTASDLQRGGISEDEAVAAARRYVDAGADLLHVVAGQTTPRSRPEYGTAFNAPWADLIRNRVGVRTITSGAIPSPAEANHVLAVGQADLCVLGRPLPRSAEWLTEPRKDWT